MVVEEREEVDSTRTGPGIVFQGRGRVGRVRVGRVLRRQGSVVSGQGHHVEARQGQVLIVFEARLLAVGLVVVGNKPGFCRGGTGANRRPSVRVGTVLND